MDARIKTGAAPYQDGSGFAVRIEIDEDGDIWLNGGSLVVTPAEWDAAVLGVKAARDAFAILEKAEARQQGGSDE